MTILYWRRAWLQQARHVRKHPHWLVQSYVSSGQSPGWSIEDVGVPNYLSMVLPRYQIRVHCLDFDLDGSGVHCWEREHSRDSLYLARGRSQVAQ